MLTFFVVMLVLSVGGAITIAWSKRNSTFDALDFDPEFIPQPEPDKPRFARFYKQFYEVFPEVAHPWQVMPQDPTTLLAEKGKTRVEITLQQSSFNAVWTISFVLQDAQLPEWFSLTSDGGAFSLSIGDQSISWSVLDIWFDNVKPAMTRPRSIRYGELSFGELSAHTQTIKTKTMLNRRLDSTPSDFVVVGVLFMEFAQVLSNSFGQMTLVEFWQEVYRKGRDDKHRVMAQAWLSTNGHFGEEGEAAWKSRFLTDDPQDAVDAMKHMSDDAIEDVFDDSWSAQRRLDVLSAVYDNELSDFVKTLAMNHARPFLTSDVLASLRPNQNALRMAALFRFADEVNAATADDERASASTFVLTWFRQWLNFLSPFMVLRFVDHVTESVPGLVDLDLFYIAQGADADGVQRYSRFIALLRVVSRHPALLSQRSWLWMVVQLLDEANEAEAHQVCGWFEQHSKAMIYPILTSTMVDKDWPNTQAWPAIEALMARLKALNISAGGLSVAAADDAGQLSVVADAGGITVTDDHRDTTP